MRVNSYAVMSECVEQGVAYGWRRAHKHSDTPDEETVLDQIEQAVMNEICERFDFSDDEEVPVKQ